MASSSCWCSDPCSFSTPNQAISLHFNLQWHVDFVQRILQGQITHTIERRDPVATHVVFDTRHLLIHAVHINGKPTHYSMDQEHHIFGQALRVELPENNETHIEVTIEYSTKPEASGLQWLDAAQTTGRCAPMVYSQCQAIHARTLMPCQDSPAIKTTYTATVYVQEPYAVAMSARLEKHETILSGEEKKNCYRWNQPIPIPTYLLAIVAGRIEKRKIGPRSHIWAEPEMIEAAAFEFANTEKYVQAFEEIAGPYVWGDYDLFLCPMSYGYGGMENANLTFVTPTLLAGDRSLDSVVAHEIAHSASGNLVTNRDWSSFWLNEGWTVWIELKIIEKIKGKPMSGLMALSGLRSLNQSIEQFGAEHPYTRLVVPMKETDPDDSFSSVPYYKGFLLLHLLEHTVGESDWAAFVKAYFAKFAYSTLDSDEFRMYVIDYFKQHPSHTKLTALPWHDLYHKPGEPVLDMRSLFDRSLIDEVEKTAQAILSGRNFQELPDITRWDANQQVLLLEQLDTAEERELRENIDAARHKWSDLLLQLDKRYKLNSCTNSEIRHLWLLLAIRAGLIPSNTEFTKNWKDFSSVGRLKFLRPQMRAAYEYARQLALNTFEEHKAFYHPVALKMLMKDLSIRD